VAVCAATILARIAWVAGAAAVSRWRCRAVDGPHDLVALSNREAAVVGWCGMRGTVTLAAALALPSSFPYRDLILFTSFAVVLGTLVLQGMTLRPLIAMLHLPNDDAVEREVRLARVETLRAALAACTTCAGAETAELVRRRHELLLRRAEAEIGDNTEDDENGRWRALPEDAEAVRAATTAERSRLVALRDNGTIGDAAFQVIEQELDLKELDLEQLVRG
jgi:CPA1 family monovalent cation:H+ antiporter